MRDDCELLASWSRDDKAAGSELFRRYFDPLYRFFVHKLPEETEDLIQSTWMACIRYGAQVSRASSFRAYLFTVARNELYRRLRERPIAKGVDFGVSSIIDVSPSPVTLAVASEQDRALVGALRTLPLESQIILELHYWEGMSTSEIAVVLEAPHGTIKSRIRRARELLEVALEAAPTVLRGDALTAWVRSMRQRARSTA